MVLIPSLDEARGEYEHYKGNRYEFVGFARDADNLAKLVVYKPLYETPEFGDILWVRPESEFFDMVIVDGKECPRFKKLD